MQMNTQVENIKTVKVVRRPEDLLEIWADWGAEDVVVVALPSQTLRLVKPSACGQEEFMVVMDSECRVLAVFHPYMHSWEDDLLPFFSRFFRLEKKGE